MDKLNSVLISPNSTSENFKASDVNSATPEAGKFYSFFETSDYVFKLIPQVHYSVLSKNFLLTKYASNWRRTSYLCLAQWG